MGLRRLIQQPIDRVQHLADVMPGLPYQPLPWLGLQQSKRAIGTEARWIEIERLAKSSSTRTAMDIGCNVGYFCLRLSEMGVATIGLEMSKRYYRLAMRAAETLSHNRPMFINVAIDPQSQLLFPSVDMVILLSVWHHWIRAYGYEATTCLLKKAWSRCDRVMLFETGEEEVASEYNLPEMKPDPRSWLTSYLERELVNARVEHLGMFKAFAPGGNETDRVVHRNLFEIVRERST